jgi:hypothetical protein
MKIASTIGAGLLSITAVEGASEIAEAATQAVSTPDYSEIVKTVIQILIGVVTLFNAFKKEKKQDVNGQ